MSLAGSLSTMPLPDVLQWLATSQKTGVLHVERQRLAKEIQLRDGRVIGCTSFAPQQRLGQYLISREKITEPQLRQALKLQESDGRPLGETLIGLGWVTAKDLAGHLECQAEETIYSLFDWSDGVFRYEDGLEGQNIPYPLDLQVQDILLRGLKRYDEMKRIRQVFHESGIVLRYTETPPGPEIFGNKIARMMYSAIDGDRTIADILLHVHGSEYIVYKFLYELHRNGYVEIGEVRSTEEAPAPPLAAAQAVESTVAGSNAVAPSTGVGGTSVSTGATAVATPVATRPADSPRTSAGPPTPANDSIEAHLATARQMMDQGDFEWALDVLDGLYAEHPNDDALRRLLAEAETAFVDRAYRHYVPADKVPVLTRPAESLGSEQLSPHDFFLLSRIDGTWDVKSIIQVAPLREVEALRTLKRMREQGVIELTDP